jgi:hypothetical protein
VFLSTQDAFGNPTDAGEASVLVDGQPASPHSTEDGRAMLSLLPPAVLDRRGAIEVEAVLDSGHATERIPLALFMRPPPPEPVQAPRYTLTPRLGLLVELSSTTGVALFVEAMASLHPSLAGFAFGATAGYLHSSFSSWNNAGAGTWCSTSFPCWPRPAIAAASIGSPCRLVRAPGSYWRRLALRFRQRSRDTAWPLPADGSTEAALLLHRSQVVFGLRYLAMSLGKLSSGDVMVGNTGGFIVDAGYRIGWRYIR